MTHCLLPTAYRFRVQVFSGAFLEFVRSTGTGERGSDVSAYSPASRISSMYSRASLP